MFDMPKLARQMLDDALPDVMEKLLQRALGGDLDAIKVVLQKGLGSAKPVTKALPVKDPAPKPQTHRDQVFDVIEDLRAGYITIEQAEAMLDVLKSIHTVEEQQLAEQLLEQVKVLAR